MKKLEIYKQGKRTIIAGDLDALGWLSLGIMLGALCIALIFDFGCVVLR